MIDNEVIIELLGEGGSRALYGVRAHAGRWFISRQLIEKRPVERELDDTATVDEFDGMQRLLGPMWPRLSPAYVHPEFRRQFLDAATGALTDDPAWLERWRAVCCSTDTLEPPRLTRDPLHVSDDWLYAEADALEPFDEEVEKLRDMLRRSGASEEVIDRMAPRKKK